MRITKRAALVALAIAAIAQAAVGQSTAAKNEPSKSQVGPASGQNGQALAQWRVGPTFEQLVEKLKDLRDRKSVSDKDGVNSAWLAEKIEIVKKALRNHHGARGMKAAMNKPGDYWPPKK